MSFISRQQQAVRRTADAMKGAGNETATWIQQHPKTVGGIALVAAPVIAVAAVPAVLSGVGFGSVGIGAGTTAAGIQSGIGSVGAGSAFAFLQSAGAGGAALGTLNTVVGATTAVAAAAAGAVGISRGGKSNDNRGGANNGEDSLKKHDQKEKAKL